MVNYGNDRNISMNGVWNDVILK